MARRAALLLALLAAVALPAPPAARAAPLPLYLSWLNAALPPGAVGPALKGFFRRLPADLCALGPAGIADLPPATMDEVRRPAAAGGCGSGSRTPPRGEG
jgi:hypothetical protein